MAQIPRRDFLRVLAMSLPAYGAGAAWGRMGGSACAPQTAAAVPKGNLVELVPPSVGGIIWRHSNGRSADYYLPETTGAGCAFLDYDNDGWMDIYLVNSGKCDSYDPKPTLRNALYRNNRDGTFTGVTEKAGVAGGGYGM